MNGPHKNIWIWNKNMNYIPFPKMEVEQSLFAWKFHRKWTQKKGPNSMLFIIHSFNHFDYRSHKSISSSKHFKQTFVVFRKDDSDFFGYTGPFKRVMAHFCRLKDGGADLCCKLHPFFMFLCIFLITFWSCKFSSCSLWRLSSPMPCKKDKVFNLSVCEKLFCK